jgi:glycosyltransferase involved in cell wall biosynthesis
VRVVLWGELFWPYIGGAELFAAKLMRSLRERGYEFAVITSHDYLDLADEAHYHGIPVYRFPFRTALAPERIDQLVALRHRIAALTRELAPGLILLNGVSPSAFFCASAGLTPAARLIVRLNRDFLLREFRATADTLLEQVLRRADWVIGVSGAMLEQARQLVPNITARSSLIYNGVEAPAAPPPAAPHDPPRILCLGRLVRSKGFDRAIDALPAILRRWPRARMTVAGDGPERAALQAQAVALGVAAAVQFTGWIAPDAVTEVMSPATVVVIPSRSDGLPAVALQAAAMGKPIIATPVAGLPEIVHHGETGLLADLDCRGLADAIAVVLEQPESARKMGVAAWRRVRQVFDQGRCVDEYDALCRQLAGPPP